MGITVLPELYCTYVLPILESKSKLSRLYILSHAIETIQYGLVAERELGLMTVQCGVWMNYS